MEAYRWTNRLLGRLAPGLMGAQARRVFMRPRRPKARPADVNAHRGVLPSGLVWWRWTPSQPIGRVLALHGWESRAAHLAVLTRALVNAHYEVIALDAPAHGASPGLEAHPVSFAEALHEAARELGAFEVGLGHSMGGGALLLAIAEGLPVKRAVTLAAPTNIEGVLQRFARYVALPEAATSAFTREVVKAVGRPTDAVSAARLSTQLSLPLLMVHDADDVEVPLSDAEQLTTQLPTACLFTTRGLGHRRLIRDPAVAAHIVDWLRTTGPDVTAADRPVG